MRKANDKMSLAQALYVSGESQKNIAAATGMSQKTICKWVKDGNWNSIRAAKQITRTELANKLLMSINKLIDESMKNESIDNSFADKLVKFASTIEKIDKKNNIVEAIDTLSAFGRWLQYRMEFDKNIDRVFVQKVVEYQGIYMDELMAGKINK